MSNHNANKLQKIIKQAAFGQGVTPMVARPSVSPAGGPSVSAAGGNGGDSPQLSAAINELGRGLERTTGRPERPLSLDEAGQNLGAGLNKTVSNNKAHESFWNNFNAIPGRALSAVNDARLAAGKAIGEGAYALGSMGPDAWTGGAKPGMTPGVTAPSANKAAPGILDQIMKSPYTPYIAGGVGTAGALGLLYAMSRRKKKQQQEQEMGEDEGDALAYGKAAGQGWSPLAGGIAKGVGTLGGAYLGAVLGGNLGVGASKLTSPNFGANESPLETYLNHHQSGFLGIGAGAALGGHAGYRIADRLTGPTKSKNDEKEEEKAGNASTGSADAYYDKKPEKMNTYEASEGVKGLTPKLQYEEHKKMSPQEFGVKASAMLGPAFIAPVAGAALGAGAGALLSKKKDRLRNALLGAGIGGAAGGAAEYAMPGVGLGAKYRMQDMYDSVAGDSTQRAFSRVPERVSEVLPYGLQRHSLPGLNAVYGQGPHN